jgi:predicted ATPase/DNA-binding SARP family transcriptional activator
MQFRLLGPVQVIGEDGAAVGLSGERERTLIAALVLGSNRPAPTARLIDALWGDDPPATAGNALQVHVSRLRKKLASAGAPDILASTPQGYELRTKPGEVDVERFGQLIGQDEGDPVAAFARLGEALALWRGPPLSDVSSDLLRGDRARLEEMHRLAVEKSIDAQLALGRHAELIGELESLVHAEPLRDSARRQLMIALYRSGRQAEALTVYREGRDQLAEQLGLDPSPELQDLELAILRHDPELGVPERTPPPSHSEGTLAPAVDWTRATESSTAEESSEVSLLFTDIEDSTRVGEEHPDEMREALVIHNELLRHRIESGGGRIFKTTGHGFHAAFKRAQDAARAAIVGQQELARTPWPHPVGIRVRMGLDTGACDERDGDFFGSAVNRAARLEAVAHGRQTVASQATAERLRIAAPEIELIELGKHRLKDLGQPENIFQIQVPGLSDEFPSLRSLDDPLVRHNLPAQVSTFVGRVKELADLRRLVDENNRLITLRGPGGSGKTRLALQVAAELVDGTGDGVWFVDLSPLSSPDLVAPTLASVLAIGEEVDRTVEETVMSALRDKNLLIVLDNCEHLIDVCAKLADQILRSCPRVHILATSREPLGIEGELVYRVPSLALPPVDLADGPPLIAYESVELFIYRARLAQPDFVVDESNAGMVGALCRRLDGIPLAIELAAARLRTLPTGEVLERLDDRFKFLTAGSRTALDRHRTLQALVDWSYDLLNGPEKEVLSRLSVFVGGFFLNEAEIVCEARTHPFDVTDLISSLVDKSLVEFDPSGSGLGPRYRLLETIREYAALRLSEMTVDEIGAVRMAHVSAYQRLAETAASRLRAQDQSLWMRRLEQDHDNLRSALDQLAADGRWDDVLAMSVNLDYFWRDRGHFNEGIDLLVRGLAETGHRNSQLAIEALLTEGALRLRRGDGEIARDVLEEALNGARRLGLDSLGADALGELAYFHSRANDLDQALALANESVVLARGADDVHVLSDSLGVRASILDRSDRPGARESWNEALESAQNAGDPRWTAAVLNNLAGRDMRDLDLMTAQTHLEEALDIAHDLQSDSLASTILTNLGCIAVMQGDFTAAWETYRDALEASHGIGSIPNTAYAMNGLALCHSGSGNDHVSIVLHAVSDSLFRKAGEVLDEQEAAMRDEDLARIRGRVGGEEFEKEYGRALERSMDSAVRFALTTVLHP